MTSDELQALIESLPAEARPRCCYSPSGDYWNLSDGEYEQDDFCCAPDRISLEVAIDMTVGAMYRFLAATDIFKNGDPQTLAWLCQQRVDTRLTSMVYIDVGGRPKDDVVLHPVIDDDWGEIGP